MIKYLGIVLANVKFWQYHFGEEVKRLDKTIWQARCKAKKKKKKRKKNGLSNIFLMRFS